MDLRIPDTQPSDEERDALDRCIGGGGISEGWQRELGGVQRTQSLRHLLLPALHALVDRVGFVSDGGLAEVCRRLEVPPAEAYGVATFYSMLPVEPVAPTTVYRCEDLACMRRPTSNGEVLDGTRVVDAPCLGLCEQAPEIGRAHV